MELKLSKAETIILERLNSGSLRAKPPWKDYLHFVGYHYTNFIC